MRGGNTENNRNLLYFPAMPSLLDSIFDRERDEAHWPPEQETLELAARGAAQVLGRDHRVTTAFAKAAETMDTADLWWARLALRTLRQGQREAIAEAVES